MLYGVVCGPTNTVSKEGTLSTTHLFQHYAERLGV